MSEYKSVEGLNCEIKRGKFSLANFVEQKFDKKTFDNEMRKVFITGQKLYNMGGKDSGVRLISNALRNVMLSDMDTAYGMYTSEDLSELLDDNKFETLSDDFFENSIGHLFGDRDEIIIPGHTSECLFDVSYMLMNLYDTFNGHIYENMRGIQAFYEYAKDLYEKEKVNYEEDSEELLWLESLMGDIRFDLLIGEPPEEEMPMILDCMIDNELSTWGGFHKNRGIVSEYIKDAIESMDESLEVENLD